MNSARVGKVLALVSPALAVGVVCFMLFATGYSQVSMEERAGSEGDPVEGASESGWMSAYEYSLENGQVVQSAQTNAANSPVSVTYSS